MKRHNRNFLLATALTLLICISKSISSSDVIPKATKSDVEGVIALDARTFDSSIRDGSAWIIEFYAPWCGHCKQFAQTYEVVAMQMHLMNKHTDEENSAEKKRKVKVAKVDGSKERALASRFSVRGFPSFFLVEGWSVRQYNGARSLEAVVKFANETYVDVEPIPFLNSPFGPVGQSRTLLMYIGTKLIDTHTYMMDEIGFSSIMAVGLLMLFGIITSLVTIIVIGILATTKMKND